MDRFIPFSEIPSDERASLVAEVRRTNGRVRLGFFLAMFTTLVVAQVIGEWVVPKAQPVVVHVMAGAVFAGGAIIALQRWGISRIERSEVERIKNRRSGSH